MVGLALMVLGVVLLETDGTELWTGLLVLVLAAVVLVGAITTGREGRR